MLKPEMLNAFVQSKDFHSKVAQRAVRLLNRSYRDKILFVHKGLSRFVEWQIYRAKYILSAPLQYAQQDLKSSRAGHNRKIENTALQKLRVNDASGYFVDGLARKINSPAAAEKGFLPSMPVISALKGLLGAGAGVAEPGMFSIIRGSDHKMLEKLKSYSPPPQLKSVQSAAQIQMNKKTSSELLDRGLFKARSFVISASRKPVMVQAVNATANGQRLNSTDQERKKITAAEDVVSKHTGAEFARSVATSLAEILTPDLQKSGYHAGSAPFVMMNAEEMQGISSRYLMAQAGVQTGPTGFDYALTLAHPSGAY